MHKISGFLKPYRFQIVILFILVFLQSISDLYLPILLSNIVNLGIAKNNPHYILKIGALMLLIATGGTILAILASFLSAKIAMGFGQILRSEFFSHVTCFSLNEFNQISTPSLINRTTNDINQLQMITMIILRMMITAPIMCIGGILMAVAKDKALSLLLIIILPILCAIIFIITRKSIPLHKSILKKLDKINKILRENLTGIRVIRAFNRNEYEKRRFHDANYELKENNIKVNQIMAILTPSLILIMNFTTIAIIWFGSIQISRGQTQLGDLIAFLQYVVLIMISIIIASNMLIYIPRAMAAASRINEVLAIVPEYKSDTPSISPSNLKGIIEFKNVTFSYPKAEEPAIKNISFCARPGQITAIIGSTGSGKSTLLDLVLHFHEPDVDHGCILIDGFDIRNLPLGMLKSIIGLVPQDSILFTGSVAHNIRFGKENATDEDLKHAAEIAQATEFILNMKHGFNSEISQGGLNISGGQRQCLSIARALVKKSKIYIFDDSFSALDYHTEAALYAALKKETVDATVLIVSQRVNTIIDADQIIVLDNGQIAGVGRHQDLLSQCLIYREMISSQLGGVVK